MVLGVMRVALHLLIGLVTCWLIFPRTDAAGRRRRIQRWSQQLLAICGIAVTVRQLAADGIAPRALIVANHVSWLDIFVINTLHPCHFVAKSDIRSWPLLGWLCAQAGTIFIARGKVRDVRRTFEHIVDRVGAGDAIAFFPEGTTCAQGSLLPFHANLFEAAIDARAPVQPFVVRYLDKDGHLAPQADYIGDTTFVESLLTILKAGKMSAELTVLPCIASTGAHRRDLAKAAQNAVADALGYSPIA